MRMQGTTRGSRCRARPIGTCVALALLLCSLGWSANARADSSPQLYRFAPAAAWVDTRSPEQGGAEPSQDASGGTAFLLLDRQINITDNGNDLFVHRIRKALNTSGVSELSQFNLWVDPGYQTLDLHWMRVIRNGKALDLSRTARITASPDETESWRQIYDGRYKIDVLLADVRVGDIVDVAFSVHSRDKIFLGHYSTAFTISGDSPRILERIRLRYPASRPIRLRLSDGSIPPPPVPESGTQVVTFQWRDRAGIVLDEDTPAWHDALPYLDISDIDDWAGVARRVAPLFDLPGTAGPLVRDLAAQIRGGGGPAQSQALRALQYVQAEIRYASISIGPSSYQPAQPDTVLNRRFGDCKDKSLLLVAVLRELGIQADVALVNSARRRGLDNDLPTPYSFNHAIVRARIGGVVYWVDTTGPRQRDPLSTTAPADFERALIADRNASALETIPRPAPESRREDLESTFDLRKGLQEAAVLKIRRSYFGSLADEKRSAFSQRTQDQLQAGRINYLARYYPDLEATGPVGTSDDPATNAFVVTEEYRIPKLFRKDDAQKLKASFHPDRLYEFTRNPEWSVRSAPLELEFPMQIRQSIIVHLPDDWEIKPETVAIDDPAFRYRSVVGYSDRVLRLTYDYETLRDAIEPGALAQYLTDRRRVFDDLGITLTRNPDAPAAKRFAIAPVPFLIIVVALALGIWLVVRQVLRYDPEPTPADPGAPSGIRGWLILPALGTAAAPVVLLYALVYLARFVDADMWYAIPKVADPAYAGVAQTVLIAYVAICCATLPFSIAVAVLLFRKRSSAPRYIVMLYWVLLLQSSAFLGAILLMGIDRDTTWSHYIAGVVRDTISTIIWTRYFAESRRVKATFVRRRSETPAIGSQQVPAGSA